ncbi:16S rRNA (uracil(1498)-N(3))-methyltransferase [Desulfoplanes formicivorans]|uniref:16S rRNA (uracil(1498)-N(3))-methyltransferase n=1 Tax=Desulfoplanes formicivorans TaxID=1592317 RepID=UPI0008532C27|nr:16S rRNA (uracil(1498)-N(3))-methyltransferase [Desulfoplanes formicivorans]
MSRTNRFYLPPDKWVAPYTLEGSEAHHLSTVLRAKPHDRIALMDGQGRQGIFKVVSSAKKTVTLEPLSISESPVPACRLWLAPGWNKATRRGWFLEKAAELGAWGIAFWQSEFSQGKTPDQPKQSWENQCIAAAKQCANPWLPRLMTSPSGLQELLEATRHYAKRIFLWEDPSCSHMLDPAELCCQGDVLVVLGPEGGFSQKETDLLQQAGCSAVSLGNRVLRWETAGLLCLGLVFWQEQHMRAHNQI